MKALLAACLLCLPVNAQVLGARESFDTEASGNSWGQIDFADPNSALEALWQFPDSDDAEIYAIFNQDFEVSLFADGISSSGSFAGDYDAVGIDTVQCDIYVQNIANFSDVEFYILSGDTFYYSDYFQVEESGWSFLENSFSRDTWYVYDDDEQSFFPIEITPSILSDVIEIGVTFYPLNSDADGEIVALDNFVLLPDLVAPPLTLEPSGNDLKIAFTGIEGIEYQLQRSSNLRNNSWNDRGDPFEITGSSETTIPLAEKAFFRLISRPFFIDLP